MKHLIVICLCLYCCLAVCPAQPPGIVYEGGTRPPDDAPISSYKQRRTNLLSTMSGRSVAIFISADVRNRQNDVDYEYRQSSNFLYLTGFYEAESLLLLVPEGIVVDSATGRKASEILFVQPRVASRELWTGVTSGVEGAKKSTGIETMPYQGLQAVLARVLTNRDTVFLTTLPTKTLTVPLSGATLNLETELKKWTTTINPSLILRNQQKQIATLRQIKDGAEQRLLQKAIDISVAGHKATIERIKPGITEYEAEAIMEGTFKALGAEDVGYPSIIGSGGNACILHYTKNRRTTRNGELLLMDCGAEYHGYSADITRTVPVNGTFSQEQKILYNLVLEAQNASINQCRKGIDWRTPHSKAVEIIRKGLLELGIIQKPEEYQWYFPHGSSHHIGLDVHDPGSSSTFLPGMILTVEPGIYIPAGSPCDKKWWNIGIRIEDDILITNDNPVILSAALPRRAEEIETLMSRNTTKGK